MESISDDHILLEYEKFDKLSKLARDFKSAALRYARVIVSERYLPDDRKTIKPGNVGGVAGGEKVRWTN